ncbi:hypothetical protein Cgig2_026009 [Carnegiea gigantea]|uniref:Uncharacterized protein n=1 Tax=Carnegiea gigantea TaxID=171969 RepID=A0A9Q1QBY0_9CARY|nr:hypothetical protein Cgig2_026009 [Carnegiea gigantea]
MVFGGREASRFASPHNNPLVVEMKVASAIVQRILIGTRSSMDIITWDYLRKLTYTGWDIVPLVQPILGFRGQEVNPIGMIHLPLCFGDKLKARNLEIDFLVIDRCSSLILVPLTREWDKLHLFGVTALSLDPLAFLYIMEVGLKVIILLEIRGQCHQDLTEEIHSLLIAPLVA